MNRRNLVLKELGLSPLWVHRGSAAAPGNATQSDLAAPALQDHGSCLDDASSRAGHIASLDWSQLRTSVSACSACALHQTRKRAVLGVGDEKAEWLFVGEGPGAEEDERGEPFVGQAGKLLDNMLATIGLRRGTNVYIANIVKCRPPGNRTPEPGEAQACEPYLNRQIALLRPRIIVALGKVAAQNLLREDGSLASLRGRVHQYQCLPVIVTYHPAYLLRNLTDKSKSWEDLCLAVETMKALKRVSGVPN